MEAEKSYLVEITPEAEGYYLELIKYLYKSHSEKNANRKSIEIMNKAESLSQSPYRGKVEAQLNSLAHTYYFLLYPITARNSIKIIYTIDERKGKVFITDFFPCQMNENKIATRSTPTSKP